MVQALPRLPAGEYMELLLRDTRAFVQQQKRDREMYRKFRCAAACGYGLAFLMILALTPWYVATKNSLTLPFYERLHDSYEHMQSTPQKWLQQRATKLPLYAGKETKERKSANKVRKHQQVASSKHHRG